jgi:OHS family lactose permease-like MFS transporter
VDHLGAAVPVRAVLPLRLCAAAENQYLAGALSGGLYIGFVFSAGSGAIEAYIERVSRNSFFEYGKARMFGCLGWAVRLHGRHPVRHRSVVCFLDGIGAALLLMLLLVVAKPKPNQTAQVMNALGANQPQITAKTVFNLFRQRRMWMFILYVIGVACVYDVFDQQFATFFKTFFATPQEGTAPLVLPPRRGNL